MTQPKSHRKVYIIGGMLALLMFGFCFAIVPFYGLICRKLGIETELANGNLSYAATATDIANQVEKDRNITVQLTTTLHKGMPWEFTPNTKSSHLRPGDVPTSASIVVHPGQTNKVLFHVKNTTDHDMVAQAIPSMTPPDAVAHFHKIQCFCFNQQPLRAHEAKDMPMVFQVDKDLPPEIHVITLSYTLYDVTKQYKKGQS